MTELVTIAYSMIQLGWTLSTMDGLRHRSTEDHEMIHEVMGVMKLTMGPCKAGCHNGPFGVLAQLCKASRDFFEIIGMVQYGSGGTALIDNHGIYMQ